MYPPENLQFAYGGLTAQSLCDATITLGDGKKYEYSFELDFTFDISIDDTQLHVTYADVDAEMISGEPSPVPDSVVAAFIEGQIDAELKQKYPNGITSIDHPNLAESIPFADTAVNLKHILVHDDRDEGDDPGDLYFEIKFEGDSPQTLQFGQFDTSSGQYADLNRQYLFKQDNNDLRISVRGVDRDMGYWPKPDNYLGDGSKIHTQVQKAPPGTHTISVSTGIVRYEENERLKKVSEWVADAICWMVNVPITVVSFFAERIFGYKMEWRCTGGFIEKTILTLVGRTWTETIESYTLEYEIKPCAPVEPTMEYVSVFYDVDAMYLTYNYSIPDIAEELGARTTAREFLGNGSISVAISENMFNKVIHALWHYGSIPRTVSTSLDRREFYASLDVEPSTVTFNAPPAAHVISTPIKRGMVGTNIGPLHMRIAPPTGATGMVDFFLGAADKKTGHVDPNKLACQLSAIGVTGGNSTTYLLDIAALFYSILFYSLPYAFRPLGQHDVEQAVAPIVDLNDTLKVQQKAFLLSPAPPALAVNDNEILLHFETTVLRATSQVIEAFSETSQSFMLHASGSLPPFVFEITSKPAHGQLSESLPELTYTSEPDFEGEDTFTFKVTDQNQQTDTGTVTILVEKPIIPHQFLAKWGSAGDGEFLYPFGIAVNANEIVYVADCGNHRIQTFNANGSFVRMWGSYGKGNGQFNKTAGIAIDTSGNVYVVDHFFHRIQVFDANGNFLRLWGSDRLRYPYGIAVDKSRNTYVTSIHTHQVLVFDKHGNLLRLWGGSGIKDSQFWSPCGIAVDESRNVYAVDRHNHRIQVFDASGNFLGKWGSEGTGDGQFQQPYGIAIDENRKVYIADWGNHRIQVFDTSGNFLGKWGSEGTGDGQFFYPVGITVDENGNTYVIDSSNRIQKFGL